MLVDCGVKYNIIRNLLKRDTTIIRVPWDYDYHNDEYDGLFLTNGPGDPKMCIKTIENIKRSFSGKKAHFRNMPGESADGTGFRCQYL